MDTNLKGKTLYKSNKNKMIDGVCAGIGEYFDIDPTLVRLAFVILCIFAGGGLLAYIVALIIIPRAPEGYDPKAAEPAQATAEPHTTADTDANSTGGNASAEQTGSDSDTPTML